MTFQENSFKNSFFRIGAMPRAGWSTASVFLSYRWTTVLLFKIFTHMTSNYLIKFGVFFIIWKHQRLWWLFCLYLFKISSWRRLKQFPLLPHGLVGVGWFSFFEEKAKLPNFAAGLCRARLSVRYKLEMGLRAILLVWFGLVQVCLWES